MEESYSSQQRNDSSTMTPIRSLNNASLGDLVRSTNVNVSKMNDSIERIIPRFSPFDLNQWEVELNAIDSWETIRLQKMDESDGEDI